MLRGTALSAIDAVVEDITSAGRVDSQSINKIGRYFKDIVQDEYPKVIEIVMGHLSSGATNCRINFFYILDSMTRHLKTDNQQFQRKFFEDMSD